MKVSGKILKRAALTATILGVMAGCPLPYDYNGKGAGGNQVPDPSSPNVTSPVTVNCTEQGGVPVAVSDGGSYVSGKTTTITLSTATNNSVIYYTDNGTVLTNLSSAKKINGSSGTITITRTTAPQTLDIHAVAVGPGMLPSIPVHIVVSVSPYPVLKITCDDNDNHDGRVNEDGGTATFTITSSTAPTSDITVSFQTSGDYSSTYETGLPDPNNTFTKLLAAGTTTMTIAVTGSHDPSTASHTVTLKIVDNTPTYSAGTPSIASFVLQDDASHTVTYSDASHTGGTVPVDSNYYVAGATVAVLGNTGNLVRTGYTFGGWNTQANGSGTTYTQGQTFTMGSANVTLYAVWNVTQYTLTITSAGNGTASPAGAITVTYGAATSINATPNTNYYFVSWTVIAGSGAAFGSTGTSISTSASDTVALTGGNVTIRATFTKVLTISTVAGNGTAGYAGDGGAATAAQISSPRDVAVDSSGNVYIADYDNDVIRKLTVSTGIITTVAGNGTAGFSGDGGAATSAQLNTPSGVSVDSSGNIYIADLSNHRVRKVSAGSGLISTIAGTGTAGFSGDGGAATSAGLYYPTGVSLDASGNVYIADQYNNRIRKVAAGTGIISTVAGNGTAGYSGDGGAATSAMISHPYRAIPDGSGNLYIAEYDNSVVRKVNLGTGIISTVAGTGAAGFSGDGGAAASAQLNSVDGVAIDSVGNLYITDQHNNRIRMVIASSGIITTIAGNGTAGFSGDGGAATAAELNAPYSPAIDASGNIYITDTFNNRIRKLQ